VSAILCELPRRDKPSGVGDAGGEGVIQPTLSKQANPRASKYIAKLARCDNCAVNYINAMMHVHCVNWHSFNGLRKCSDGAYIRLRAVRRL